MIDPRLQQIIDDPTRRGVIRMEAKAALHEGMEIPARVITLDDLDEFLAARIRGRGERFLRDEEWTDDD